MRNKKFIEFLINYESLIYKYIKKNELNKITDLDDYTNAFDLYIHTINYDYNQYIYIGKKKEDIYLLSLDITYNGNIDWYNGKIIIINDFNEYKKMAKLGYKKNSNLCNSINKNYIYQSNYI